MIPPALLLVLALSPHGDRDTPALGGHTAHLYAADASASPAAEHQQKGRYKKQGNTCEWDANDNGPNQCTPVTKGRFKKSGDACRWAFNDVGPDQCRPAKGRWTKSGARCVWRPSDSGPDQCNPRQPR
jgi:hypothetical protein